MSISPVSASNIPNHAATPYQARPGKPAAPAPTALVQTATQEAAETPVQTSQEASKGDPQAQRWMAAHSTPTVNTSGQPVGLVVNTKA